MNKSDYKVIEWKAVDKTKVNWDNFIDNIIDKIQTRFKNFKFEDNIHKILWVILLVVWLRQLRQWLLWLILIIFWILFVTWYFDKTIKK